MIICGYVLTPTLHQGRLVGWQRVGRTDEKRGRKRCGCTRNLPVASPRLPRFGLDGGYVVLGVESSRRGCDASFLSYWMSLQESGRGIWGLGLSSSHGCESSPGHRILEQATRGSLRPKCLIGAAGRVPFLCRVLGHGVQHEPVTGAPGIIARP